MAHYNRVFKPLWKRPLKATRERRQKILARLQTFTADELMQAVTNIRASPYHCGRNEAGRIYATPEFIFRNDTITDTWLKAQQNGRADEEPDLVKLAEDSLSEASNGGESDDDESSRGPPDSG